MNKFLQTRKEISSATSWLKENGYVGNPIDAKNWELKLIIESLKDGDLLDMGADGSRVLQNAIIKNISGRKVGIDLAEVTGDNKAEGAEYYIGDLTQTPFPFISFATIVSQSVLEHGVDFEKFAAECARLLISKGELVVSFDYWPDKINTDGIKLYGLPWNILSREDVMNLVLSMDRCGLSITGEIDWTIKDAVINPKYCSPAAGISYSFGILSFIKD